MSATFSHAAAMRRRGALDVAVVVVGLLAVGSTFLTVIDREVLYNCGCAEPFRPASEHVYVPALGLVVLAAARLVWAGAIERCASVRFGMSLLTGAASLAVILFLLISVPTLMGPGATPGELTHGALLALVVIRAVVTWR